MTVQFARGGLSIGSVAVEAGPLDAGEAHAMRRHLDMALRGIEVPPLARPVHIETLSVRLSETAFGLTPSRRGAAIRDAINAAIADALAYQARQR